MTFEAVIFHVTPFRVTTVVTAVCVMTSKSVFKIVAFKITILAKRFTPTCHTHHSKLTCKHLSLTIVFFHSLYVIWIHM